MARQVMLKKGSANRIRYSITSYSQAKRISNAIKSLQRLPLDELEQRGLVKKLKVAGRNDVYSFHVGLKERIVFSPIGDKYVIHDIVDLKGRPAKSLIK